MTSRSVEWEEAIQRLYESGLSRRQIHISLQENVSERFIREQYERMTPEQRHYHQEAMHEIREKSKGLAHSPKQYSEVVDGKAIGRGFRRVKGEGLLDNEAASEYWTKWHEEHPEGSP